MTDAIIDCCARAAYEVYCANISNIHNLPWEDAPEDVKELAHCQARAVLKAVREATGEMYIAGCATIPGDPTTMELLIDYLGTAYKAMIDVALRPEKPPSQTRNLPID